ncbi:MAG: hypothetical protein HC852_06760 [Acaryochloridaceae cyanobacterium RU_4_10]|nr:hypothetical protein [Acaryochloridaceae cyanobacterium RU_4_10]
MSEVGIWNNVPGATVLTSKTVGRSAVATLGEVFSDFSVMMFLLSSLNLDDGFDGFADSLDIWVIAVR